MSEEDTLSPLDRELIALIKREGENLDKLIMTILEHENKVDASWVHIGRTDLQKGIMALVRAVANPEGF